MSVTSGSKLAEETRSSHVHRWMRAGSRGPLTLDDPHGREKIHAFDHERVPERVVHARGAAAHGTFTCHTPIPEVTSAGILSEKGKTCPV